MDKPRRVLLIQLKRAGDVVLATAVLPILAQRLPEAQIDFLVGKDFAPILENNPWIHEVLPYDGDHAWGTLRRIRAQRYDWVIDFQSSPRTALLCLASAAAVRAGYQVPFWGGTYGRTVPRPKGSESVVRGKCALIELLVGSVETLPESRLFLSAEEKDWSQRVIGASPGRGVVGMVPAHRRASRRWRADGFAAAARDFQERGFDVWLFWGPGEQSYVEGVRAAAPGSRMTPPTSLRQMAALLARCDVVVTNDSGPMHLAVAVGVPTVTVYGPTDPACWNPGGPQHAIVQAAGLACLGCNLNECPFGHECMTQVTSEDILRAAERILARPRISV
jgi:lipopolysaccharide heptosyltransferase II